MESPHVGIFGRKDLYRQGLIAAAGSEEQIDLILNEAKKHGVRFTPKEAQEAKRVRLEQLEKEQKLDAFYAQKGILKEPKQLLKVNLAALGLNLNESAKVKCPVKEVQGGKKVVVRVEEKNIRLEHVAEKLIKKINKTIQNAEFKGSFKKTRTIQLFPHQFLDRKLWLKQIIEALVEKGYLYNLKRVDGRGYQVQA
jgi:hypothetical protein